RRAARGAGRGGRRGGGAAAGGLGVGGGAERVPRGADRGVQGAGALLVPGGGPAPQSRREDPEDAPAGGAARLTPRPHDGGGASRDRSRDAPPERRPAAGGRRRSGVVDKGSTTRVRRRGAGGSDVDAEVGGDARQAGGVALAHGAELPLGPVAVQLAEDHGGLGGGVLGQVVAGDLAAVGLVDDPDEGVADLAEVLLAAVGVVDRH